MSQEHISEVTHHFAEAKRRFSEVEGAQSAFDLRVAWTAFLESYARAIGRMISLSLNGNAASKSWGNRLKNASNGQDEGLRYLREARNAEEHGLGPSAEFTSQSTDIGDAIGFVGVSEGSVSSQGLQLDGVHVGDGVIEFRSGVPRRTSGTIPFQFVPAAIKLLPVDNPDKKLFGLQVPKSVRQHELKDESSLELGRCGLAALDEILAEFKIVCQGED